MVRIFRTPRAALARLAGALVHKDSCCEVLKYIISAVDPELISSCRYEDACEGVISPRTPAYNYSGPHRTKCSKFPPSGAPACCSAPKVDPTECFPCPTNSTPFVGPVRW